MHRAIRTVMAAFVAAILLIPSSASAQTEATPDPSAVAAEQARQRAEAAAAPRFDPSLYGQGGGCVNEPPEDQHAPASVPPGVVWEPGANGGPGWQVAWIGEVRPSATVRLTLRDKYGTGRRWVYADIYRPDGTRDRFGADLLDDRAGTIPYPSAFRGALPMPPGTYTVVWRDSVTDRFITCAGFVVAP